MLAHKELCVTDLFFLFPGVDYNHPDLTPSYVSEPRGVCVFVHMVVHTCAVPALLEYRMCLWAQTLSPSLTAVLDVVV